MRRRPLTLLILCVVALCGLGWLVLRGGGSGESAAAADLPEAPTSDRAPALENLAQVPDAASPEPEREAQAAEPERGEKRLFGRITDEAGLGIAGARVLLYDARRNSVRGITGKTVSDSGGRYAMDHSLRAGRRLGLAVSAEGFLTGVRGPVEVSDGSQKIDVVLGGGEGLAGLVRWENGQPAIGATVDVRGRTRDAGGAQGMQAWKTEVQSILGSVDSDDSGHFVLHGSAEGALSIRARGEREGEIGFGFADDVNVGEADLEIVLRGGHELDVEVVDDIGEPVKGVSVILLYGRDREDGMHPDDRAENLVDDEGRYRLEGLRRGDWSVRVRATAYCPANEGDDQAFVQLPQEDSPLRFTLLRPGSIRGQLVDSLGKPLAQTEVTFRSESTRERAKVDSDADGQFHFEHAAAGSAVLRSEAGALEAQVTVEVWPGQEARDVELRLSPGGTVRLQVVDADGQPLAKRMTFLLAGTEDVQDEETNELGVSFLGPVPPGEYTVAAILMSDEDMSEEDTNESEMFESLRSVIVEVVEGEELQVTLAPGTRPTIELSGRVTLAGEPVAEEEFMLFREGAGLVEAIRQLQTDENGAYRVKLDAAGAFLMLPQDSEVPWAVARFEVPDVPHHVLDLALPEGRIAGRVLGGEQARCRVTLEREDALLDIGFPDAGSGVSTNDDGRFAFELLQPGTFTLRVRGGQGQSWQPLTGLVLGDGQALTGIEISPSPAGVVLGEVRNPGGVPEPKALVYLRAENGTLLHRVGAPTNEQGQFRIEDVPPGHWTASAHAAGLASATRALDTTRGDLSEVRLILAPGARLEVRLLEPSGEPARAALHALDQNGLDVSRLLEPALQESGFTSVLEPSVRKIGPLPPGHYRIRAVAPDGRSAEQTVRLSGDGTVLVELTLE